jgi:hypothetical protein
MYLANVYFEIFSFRVLKFCNLVLRVINTVVCFKVVLEKKKKKKLHINA